MSDLYFDYVYEEEADEDLLLESIALHLANAFKENKKNIFMDTMSSWTLYPDVFFDMYKAEKNDNQKYNEQLKLLKKDYWEETVSFLKDIYNNDQMDNPKLLNGYFKDAVNSNWVKEEFKEAFGEIKKAGIRNIYQDNKKELFKNFEPFRYRMSV